ncbi:MAG TPA: ATP-binding cassette domain-containing protein [Polyangiaceae bacterium]|nr:ATP-binding cassette domain-containing protein [Polyangiaceae bacterium]
MAGLSIRGLTMRFPARRGDAHAEALLDLDLDVADGELLVLVGPSGCGKSTALRLVAGLERPTKGTIELDGRALAGVPPQERDVAMVFQGYALYPHLTVAENMGFSLKMRDVPRTERERRVGEIARMVGLADKLERMPAELSGGERQRVAMGRAIVRQPKLFLFDEPLSNLDAKLRAELRVELVALLRRLGTTAIYVTHDQAEAMTMGDRVAVLNAGKLMQIGTPRSIYEDPQSSFVAGFVGSPAMNLVTVKRVGERIEGPLSWPAPSWLPTAPLIVGFRPEHLRIGGEPAGALRARAEVVTTEPLGAETFVHLDAGGTALRGRLDGFGGPEPGSTIDVSVADAHLYFFDERGARLIEAPA